jgi:gluconate 2-dehydrogenase gamma chain
MLPGNPPNRREFLGGMLALTAAGALPGGILYSDTPAAPSGATEILPAPLSPPPYVYRALGADEIVFVEALVDVLCPADELTPGGVDCGLAAYIDAQLAGPFGKGERVYLRGPWEPGPPELGYQLPLTPEAYFKAGVATMDRAARQAQGSRFAELDPPAAEAFLQRVVAGAIPDATPDLPTWFNTLAYPLFVEACFSDPVYGGNRDKVFWRLIGYPGLPAIYGRDIVTYRGKLHPAARTPRSMTDFA